MQDDEEPQDTQYQIDGAYIPRIFILGKPKNFLVSPRVFGSEEIKGLYIMFQLSLPIFGYIIYYTFVFGYVEKYFGRLGGALANLKEVYWYVIDTRLPHLTFFSFFGGRRAWSARHAWRKRGKNITHNSNNYFFNLFVITHVWCCLPMSALHLPSLA